MSDPHDLSSFDKSPHLYLFTSLTSGSSHIFTATSRMETILKANRIPFLALDTATDEKARRLWQRRSQGKKLPGLVKDGFVLGGIDDVEEWNEFGELRDVVGNVPGLGEEGKRMGYGPLQGGSGQKDAAAATHAPKETPGVKEVEGKDADPMRDLAAQAASIGLARQKGPSAGVDASKIKPLQGVGTKDADVKSEIPAAGEKETTAGAGKEEIAPKPEEGEKITADALIVSDAAKPETMNSATAKKEESVGAATAKEEGGEPASPSTGAAAGVVVAGLAAAAAVTTVATPEGAIEEAKSSKSPAQASEAASTTKTEEAAPASSSQAETAPTRASPHAASSKQEDLAEQASQADKADEAPTVPLTQQAHGTTATKETPSKEAAYAEHAVEAEKKGDPPTVPLTQQAHQTVVKDEVPQKDVGAPSTTETTAGESLESRVGSAAEMQDSVEDGISKSTVTDAEEGGKDSATVKVEAGESEKVVNDKVKESADGDAAGVSVED